MIRNDAAAFSERLYSRLPSHYRVLDVEQGYPLRALFRVIGEQAANLRRDLDDLWDNYFIETCDDWVIPYLASLVGANLLPTATGQSHRLDVRNTVLWRRRKGTPQMLRQLAEAVSEWPTGFLESFQSLGWSQNLNHLRLNSAFTADVRDPARLARLGRGDDPLSHHADFKPVRSLDQARTARRSLGIGVHGWTTPGRYQIRNLGFFLRRLRTFTVNGAEPAAAAPGAASPAGAVLFTFDPTFRNTPLFIRETGEPLSRDDFNRTPHNFFGRDLGVRHHGVLLASAEPPLPAPGVSTTPFTFSNAGAGIALHPAQGMRLPSARDFDPSGGANFVVHAEWRDNGASTILGSLSTYYAARGLDPVFSPGAAAPSSGRLVISIQLGQPSSGWIASEPLPSSPPARFPGAVLALRRQNDAIPLASDALYVYLPPVFLAPGDSAAFFVAADGATYRSAQLGPLTLARQSEGQVYPARPVDPATALPAAFASLNRGEAGIHLSDPSRFGTAQVLIRVSLFSGAYQPMGAIATVAQNGADYPDLDAPAAWPAYFYAPSKLAINDNLPPQGLLAVNVKPLSGSFVPAFELTVRNRAGNSLLIYVPESSGVGTPGKDYLVAADGSTYDPPSDPAAMAELDSLSGLALARAAAGQVLPIARVLPLQQRVPVALNLCRPERNALLRFGELGVDPELGRFAFPPGDPAIGQSDLTVDYTEAFSDATGARPNSRPVDLPAATRFIAKSGDAPGGRPVHISLEGAIAAARDGDVIEFADSATYLHPSPVAIANAALKKLSLRAGQGQRPCLAFYRPGGAPAAASLRVTVPLDSLDLDGLWVSGAPLLLERPVKRLLIVSSTLEPLAGQPSLIALDDDLNAGAEMLFCRAITGALRTGQGVSRLIVADSIVDATGQLAISGAVSPFARGVQLERVTVFGRIHCDVLNASESLLDDLATAEDRQTGCVRFCRYELGSVLPRRFQCVPGEDSAVRPGFRTLAPLFNSRSFGRPDYAQLAAGCPSQILTAGEAGAEVGAFASTLNTIRAQNVQTKLGEFLPVGLSAVLIAET